MQSLCITLPLTRLLLILPPRTPPPRPLHFLLSAHASLLTQEEYFKLIGQDMPVAFESDGSFKG